MGIKLPAATANAMMDAGIGVPANSGKLQVYDGTQPVGGGAITTQHKLCEFTMAADAFPACVGGVLTANGITPSVVLVAGTPTWYRLLKSDGTTTVIDGSAGPAGSPDNPNLVLDSETLVKDKVIGVGSFIVRLPLS